MATRRTITTPAATPTYSDAEHKKLEESLAILNEINNALGSEVENLKKVNDQYEFGNDLLSIMAERYEEISRVGIDNNETAESINRTIAEQRKLLEKNLEKRLEEQHLVTGLNVVYAQINQQLDKSAGLAATFKKEGEAMFSPKMFQPAIKAFESFQIRFGKFGEERTNKINAAIQQLREEGKTTEAAMMELQESKLYKGFEMLGPVLSAVFDKLKSLIFSVFKMVVDVAKKIGEAISKIPGLLLDVTKSALVFSKTMTEKIGVLTQAIVAIPLNILEKAQELGYEIKKEMNELAQTFENLQKDFMGGDFIGQGFARLQSNLIGARKEFMDVNTEAVHLFGRGISGINKAFQETQAIVKSLGVFTSLFAEQITKNKENAFYYFKMKQVFDMTDEDLQYIARTASNTGKSLATVFQSVSESIDDAAKVHRQDAKQMARDYLDMRKNVISFGHITDKELGNVVARTRQMRVEMKDAVALFEKVQTFEDAANMSSQLSQSFNMVVDSMELLKAESPDQMLKMLRDAMFATGRSFQDMNRFEKSLLQQQTGLSSEAMQALFSFQNVGKTYSQIMTEMNAKDPVQQQIKGINQMKDAIVELKETMPKFQNSFDAFFTGIKDNTLLSNTLRKSLSGLSLSFDGIYTAALNKDTKLLEPALTSIVRLIEKVKDVLTNPAFLNSLNNILNAAVNIVEMFFDLTTMNFADFDNFLKQTGSFSQQLDTQLQKIFNNIIPTFNNLFVIGTKIVESFILAVTNSLDDIFSIVLKSFSMLFNKTFFNSLIKAIDKSLENIVNFLTNNSTKSSIFTAFQNLFDFADAFLDIGLKYGKQLLDAILGGMSDVSNSDNIINKMSSFFKSILDKIFGTLDKSSGIFKNGFLQDLLTIDPGNVINGIKNIAKTVFTIMIDVIDRIVYAAAQILPKIAEALKDFASGANLPNFVMGFNDQFTRITKNLGIVVDKLFADTSGSILGSLFTLAEKFFVYLGKFKTSEGKSLIDLFKDLIGIASEYYVKFYTTAFYEIASNFGKEIVGAVLLGFTGAIATMKIFGSIIKNSIIDGGAIHAKQIARAIKTKRDDLAELDLDKTAGSKQKGGWSNPKYDKASKWAAGAGLAMGLADAAELTPDGGGWGHAMQAAEFAAMGSAFGPWGIGIGAAIGLGSSLLMNDGFISKDGKVVKIHDNDNVIAFKENGPIMNSAGKSQSTSSSTTPMIKPEDLKAAVRDAIIEGFKSQNQTIEVKLNGEKVGEGLLASGFVNMMTNANKTKGAPTINPNSVIYRDGQIPSSGYISQ
jgi:tetratricopeptide (TPR) repeat protein